METIKVLYEDKFLIVIYKPSGILSTGYDGCRQKTAETIIDNMLRKRGVWTKQHRAFCVHRLDLETSGVMMFALTEVAKIKIMNSWHKMVKERIYHAIAENPRNEKNFLPDEGIIDEAIAKNAHNFGYVPKQNGKQNSVVPKVEVARTHFKVIARGYKYTLFELKLDTGKKNQIRAHLASKGYKLCGDSHCRSHAYEKQNPLGRLGLHARTLTFTHPFTNEELHFEIAEPESWLQLVKKMPNTKQYSKKTIDTQHEHRSTKKSTQLSLQKQKNSRVTLDKSNNH